MLDTDSKPAILTNMNATPHTTQPIDTKGEIMADTRECLKCKGLQLAQTVSDDITITQYRCLNCGRIDEPGLVPNTRRIVYERPGRYSDLSADNLRRRQRAKEKEYAQRRNWR